MRTVIYPQLATPTFSHLRFQHEAHRQGLDAQQLAALAGLPWTQLRHYWYGHRAPRHETLLVLAEALETDTAALCELTFSPMTGSDIGSCCA